MTDLSDMRSWLDSIGLGQHAEAFESQDIDRDVASDLSEADLKELGLSLGHRKKFLRAVASLGNADAPVEAPKTAPRPRDPNAGAERRQLTVMFCDLVGSTELSTKLDVEDLREVISDYQDACRSVIDRYGGYIARYMGDGILIYFGYPVAHEDDGHRAVQTGLEVIDAVRALKLRPGLDLEVRIGVATGVVIVGDIIGEGASEESAVLGETPNLAARLQGLAAPNTMVISPETRRLVEGRFRFEDLGEHTVKGIAQPVRAWGVSAALSSGDRFAARRKTKLVGRDQEMALIEERWHRALAGDGQALVLSGEAGIGKSRLVQAIKDMAGIDQARVVHVSCSSYHTQHPLYPFVDELPRLAGFVEGDTADTKLTKIEDMLRTQGREVNDEAPLLADFLSVAVGERYPPHGLSPQALRARILNIVVDLLLWAPDDRAALLVFDDAHWSDPTSIELMTIALDAAVRRPCSIVVTCRPEFEVPWRRVPHLATLNLQRLTAEQAGAVITDAAGGAALPDSIVATIVEKADGVPLFLEELTTNVIESGLMRERDGAYELDGPLPPLAIPTTLHDSLMARLDRLPTAKEIAQIGAAIGRQFDYELIAAVTDLTDERLQDALGRLKEAEIVFDDGAPPKASYLFKHALVQDAAYESLLRKRRQELHGRIVNVLESRFPDTADAEPGVLGRHCAEARLYEQAARYYQKAGLVGALRSSMREALAQLELGLRAAAKIEDETQRARLELDLRMTLVFPLRALKGLGAKEVEQNYQRAFELARDLEAGDQVLPVLYGLFAVVWARGDIAAASRRAADLLAQANAAGDPLSLVIANYATGLVSFFLGKLDDCVRHFDVVLDAYDAAQHAPLALTYAIEFGVGAWNYRALCTAAMGRYAEAEANLQSATDLGRRLNHPFPLSHALGVGSATYLYLRDFTKMLAFSDEAIAVAREQGFAPYLAIAQLCHGWARALSGDAAGLDEMDTGVGAWAGGGYGLATPWFRVRHAEAMVASDRANDALAILEDALEAIEKDPQVVFQSIALTVRGDAHAARGNREQAEDDYRAAIEVANHQGANGERLRAVVRLASLLKEGGRGAEVSEMLAATVALFENENTADVVAARELLTALGG